MCDACRRCTFNTEGLPAAVARPLLRHRTANNRLLDWLLRARIGDKYFTDVILHRNRVHVLDVLPSAGPLHQHLLFSCNAATQQHTHDLPWRGHISSNPAALPLHEALIDAGALAAAHYEAIPALHLFFVMHNCRHYF